CVFCFFFSSRRRHTRYWRDWSSDVCSSDLGVHPPVHTYGGVGTGDLQALAQTGLALIGELPWQAPARAALPAPVTLRRGDALALMSSNALTLGQAALACNDLDQLLRASHAVTALSLAAVSASPEPYAPEVHAARPHPGTVRAAAEVRRLLGPAGLAGGPRVQDPFGFRCFPQAHGPALEAAEALGAVLAGLGDPELTGLRPFLADGPAASSGTMILEYSANAALAELRACAAPASTG